VDSWPFFRVARSLRIHSDMLVARALKNSQLIRQLPDETHVSYGTGHLYQAGMIGPPETPSVFTLFLDWHVNQ